MADIKRVSLSLPSSVVEDLDYISNRLGISRSGFLTQVLLQSDLASLRALLASIPESPTDDDVKRFRGSSVDFIRERVEALQQLQGGLFDGSGE